MTQLQALAFERIEKLGTEALALVPTRFDVNASSVEMTPDDLTAIADKLYEQQLWIESLTQEESHD